MSNPTIEMTSPDIYGQCHPIENVTLIETKLKEFEEELLKLPEEKTISLKMANEQCPPNYINDDFKLMFLRCEVYNVDLAAKRYASYWDKRRELYGDDKAFLPLTQHEANVDDTEALNMGFIRVLENCKDPTGRQILFLDPSCQDRSKYTRESMTRSLWYVLHKIVMNDITTQQKGIIFIGYPKHVKHEQFDRIQVKMNIESIKGCLPLRLSAIHMCHPPTIFQIIFPIVSLFLGERIRKRVRIHSGSIEKVVQELTNPYGITKDKLPTIIGGTIQLNHKEWLIEQATIEGG